MAKRRKKFHPKAPYPGLPEFPAYKFGWHEVRCKHCEKKGDFGFPEKVILESEEFQLIGHVVAGIRGKLGRPLVATSWYRCPEHPIEARKRHYGAHTECVAADLAMTRFEVALAVESAMVTVQRQGHDPRAVLGFGLKQAGPDSGRYMHVDVAGLLARFRHKRGNLWTY